MDDDESWRLPEPVQQVAASVQEPPNEYLLPEQQHLCAGTKMPEPVPTIDIGLLLASDDAEEATKLRSALQTWGFFQVSNHGIETFLMDSVMAASRDFLGLTPEAKKKYSNLIDGKDFQLQGYGNDQVKAQDQTLDWCDRLNLIVEPEGERNLAIWPIHPTSFRDNLHEYTIKSRRVKDDILRAIAKLLELDEDCLINQFGDKAPTNARFNYYPPCPRPDLVSGIKPHSDVAALTVLLMDKDVAGLQFLGDGTWYDVPAPGNNTLLINIGVTLEIMTNGIFSSPMHKVVTNAEKERLSLAMFYSMDFDKEVGPVAHLLDEERPARYKRIKAGDLLATHLDDFSRGERVVNSLKI